MFYKLVSLCFIILLLFGGVSYGKIVTEKVVLCNPVTGEDDNQTRVLRNTSGTLFLVSRGRAYSVEDFLTTPSQEGLWEDFGDYIQPLTGSPVKVYDSGVISGTKLNASEIKYGVLGYQYFSAYGDLYAAGKIGSGSGQVAAGDHTHAAADIVSGVFNDARLPTNILRTDRDTTITGFMTFAPTEAPLMPPFAVAPENHFMVENLNAEMLNGKHSSDFAAVDHTHTLSDLDGNILDSQLPLHGTWNFGGDGTAGVINVMSDAGDATIVIDGMQNRIEIGSIKIGANYSISSAGLVANDKIADSDKWDGHQFDDYLDQAVKTSSTPTFEDIILSSSDPTVVVNTSSGSDNKRLCWTGAGGMDDARGAQIEVRGNQYGGAGERGVAQVIAGYGISSPSGDDGTVILVTNHTKRLQVRRDGGILFPPLATSPANVEGVIYYESDQHHAWLYNGSAWKQLDNACVALYQEELTSGSITLKYEDMCSTPVLRQEAILWRDYSTKDSLASGGVQVKPGLTAFQIMADTFGEVAWIKNVTFAVELPGGRGLLLKPASWEFVGVGGYKRQGHFVCPYKSALRIVYDIPEGVTNGVVRCYGRQDSRFDILDTESAAKKGCILQAD